MGTHAFAEVVLVILGLSLVFNSALGTADSVCSSVFISIFLLLLVRRPGNGVFVVAPCMSYCSIYQRIELESILILEIRKEIQYCI